MRGQSGSILVTVLALSLILTAAVGSYLALGANAGGANADSQRLSMSYLAAESGLNLGVRWCAYYTDANLKDVTWANNLVLTESAIPGVAGWADFDGVQVKVVFNVGTGLKAGFHELDSYATMGPGRDTIKLTMQITGADPISGAPIGAPVSQFTDNKGYLNYWTDSLFPGK
jgi:hypothetical protein